MSFAFVKELLESAAPRCNKEWLASDRVVICDLSFVPDIGDPRSSPGITAVFSVVPVVAANVVSFGTIDLVP